MRQKRALWNMKMTEIKMYYIVIPYNLFLSFFPAAFRIMPTK